MDVQQGRKAGRHWPAETEQYTDSVTGASVRRLTNHPGADDRHLYFTEPGWYDDGRRLLFRSDRDETWGLYSVDLETGLVTQLTDLPTGVSGITRCANEPVAYFWCGSLLVSLDLGSLDVTTLYECPTGYSGSVAAATADGERVVTAISEDTDIERDGDNRESWMAARMRAAPHSEIVSVPTDGTGNATVHTSANRWLNHVNASPTRPELVTYCEEGPWEDVSRIWGLNLETDESWRVRPTGENEAVGHEYWLADGEYVGYHGWRGSRDDPDAFFGQVRYDGTDRREGVAPDLYTHYHSNTRDLVVGDGTYRGAPYNMLWRWDPKREAYETPRKLASHEWQNDGDTHPHSRIGPDDGTVVFDSTRGGEDSDVYVVEIPDALDSLPRFEGLSH